MKTAFTMIELIFTIIILGILAGIAVSRYVPLITTAHYQKIIDFTRTLNASVGEQLWGQSLRDGKKGDISYLGKIDKWIKPPKEINGTSIDVSNCDDPSSYKTIAESLPKYTDNKKYYIQCKDGTSIHSPYFRLTDENGNVVYSRD